jgi:hypothetical protein
MMMMMMIIVVTCVWVVATGHDSNRNNPILPAIMPETTTHEAPETALAPTALPNLLAVVLSASRPSKADFVTPLTRLLAATVDHIAVYDADAESTRSFPWAHTIVQGPARHIDVLVQSAKRDFLRDKHRDPLTRIAWRSKNALDYAYALEYAYEQRHRYAYALVLEDDAWFAHDFARRLAQLVHSNGSRASEEPPSTWWTLFHSQTFDTRSRYADGDSFEFKACTQAMLYPTASLRPFVAFVKANYREDPFDWLVRNYQYDTHQRIQVAIPSMVQHVGAASKSTLADKQLDSQKSGCHAFDFVQPAVEPSDAARAMPVHTQQRIVMHASGIPPDAMPRDRRKLF